MHVAPRPSCQPLGSRKPQRVIVLTSHARDSFLIEKGYCNGRAALNLPAEATIDPVVRIQSISGGNIDFADPDLCW